MCLGRSVCGLVVGVCAADGVRGSERGYCDVIRLLLRRGGAEVVDARDDAGRTALWWACQGGEVERARVLLVEGWADRRYVRESVRVTAGGRVVVAEERGGWREGEINGWPSRADYGSMCTEASRVRTRFSVGLNQWPPTDCLVLVRVRCLRRVCVYVYAYQHPGSCGQAPTGHRTAGRTARMRPPT